MSILFRHLWEAQTAPYASRTLGEKRSPFSTPVVNSEGSGKAVGEWAYFSGTFAEGANCSKRLPPPHPSAPLVNPKVRPRLWSPAVRLFTFPAPVGGANKSARASVQLFFRVVWNPLPRKRVFVNKLLGGRSEGDWYRLNFR